MSSSEQILKSIKEQVSPFSSSFSTFHQISVGVDLIRDTESSTREGIRYTRS